MKLESCLAWQWQAEEHSPQPQAAVAIGRAARLLLDRLREPLVTGAPALFVTANADALIVIGPTEALPWVSGIAYAATSPEAPLLWLPTLSRPDVPLDLLERSLLRRHGRKPLLLWPEPAMIMPLDRQLPVTADLLDQFASRWQV